MNKKNLIVIGIVVIIVLIVIFGVIGLNKNTANAPEIPNGVVSTSTPAQTTSTASSTTVSSSGNSVSVAIQKTYVGKSFSFNYPISWGIVSQKPFSMDNFQGNYAKGGIIPPGGAEIDIATTTTSGPVEDIINTELMNATNITASTVTVDGVSCQKETYEAHYAPSATSKDISLYCSRGNELWKIYLSYPLNDSAEKAHIVDFDGVLSSMKLL